MAASTHEPYYMTTRDFEAWSPPLPLELPPEDAGRSVIDLFLLLGAAGTRAGTLHSARALERAVNSVS